MRVQTVVQHHPSRAHLLPSLLAALPAGTQIVTDPEPANRSPWATYLQCLRSLEDDATHLCLIQDDAQPCRDFGRVVDLLARKHRNAPVALFVPGLGNLRRVILNACQRDERYAELPTMTTFVPCVAMLWPREQVESILRYEAVSPSLGRADDGALGRWARATRTQILACVPSICEHPDVTPSLVGRLALSGRNPSRCAACWVGEEVSPLTLQW